MTRSKLLMLLVLCGAATMTTLTVWTQLQASDDSLLSNSQHEQSKNSHIFLSHSDPKPTNTTFYSSQIHASKTVQLQLNTTDGKPIQLLFVPDRLQWVKVPERGTTVVQECDVPCVYGGDTSTSNLKNTDALVLHLPDLNGEDPRSVLKERELIVPDAYIVGMTLEPTAKYRHQFDRIKDYDIEMTFRMMSDVPAVYQKFWKKERNILMDPIVPWEKRKKAVAFVADNCNSSNHREDLVKLFEKHTKVESVSTCLPNAPWPKDIPRTNRRLNKVVLLRRYLANIAAENSFEDDYVSEKVYDALIAGTVPIYFGASNIDSFVPSDTIIKVPQNFTEADVIQIVQQLNKVYENKDEYEKWISFKRRPLEQWFSQRFNFTKDNMKCRLCRRVHSLKNGYHWDKNEQKIIY